MVDTKERPIPGVVWGARVWWLVLVTTYGAYAGGDLWVYVYTFMFGHVVMLPVELMATRHLLTMWRIVKLFHLLSIVHRIIL